ncbi:RelA/SpoT domain-containing protein [Rhizobium sp.]|uniref:RelA/SpoT domain-containing protein n=1 Tax=Rhizobium sp. TaxID=391 RepID=UPI0028AF3564
MNFTEYETSYYARYEAFAAAVRDILTKAIEVSGDIPRPQTIQARAKTPLSLRKRLEETAGLDCDVAVVRRDLAGVRLIFYTNNDADRFINSSIIFDNFEVDRDATKIHHPIEENGAVQYRAIHYTVALDKTRSSLPEYVAFRGLKCEIQIQTVLIHAWAETSHDIIYKFDQRDGFGTAAFDQIRMRFDKIMEKYLVPAGYEFQRVQLDYERLRAGKILFDQGLLEALGKAQDNNERHQLISSLADDLLPLYDDIPSIFPEVLTALVASIREARGTPTAAIEHSFGYLEGRSAIDVTSKAIDLISRYKYASVEQSYLALQSIFVDETDGGIRKNIFDTVANLAGYDLGAWRQLGPDVQRRLAFLLENRAAPVGPERTLATAVWSQLLEAEADGVSWTHDAASFEFGEVPLATVTSLREKAINSLFDLFRTSDDEEEKREIYFALDKAKNTFRRSQQASANVVQSFSDYVRVVEFLTDQTESISYELRQTIEETAHYHYHHVRAVVAAAGVERDIKERGEALLLSIIGLRDRFNSDPIFVRHKIFVGFESVVPGQWEDSDFDPEKVDQYRNDQIELYAAQVSPANQEEWLVFIKRCAATKSDDGATFPKFGMFIADIGERRPEVADWWLARADENLLRFLPGFLNGLLKSDRPDIYRRNLEHFILIPARLNSIAIHWRGSLPEDPATYKQLVGNAIDVDDRRALAECLLFEITSYPNGTPPKSEAFLPALRHLVGKQDPNWLRGAYLPQRTAFFNDIDDVVVGLIVDSYVELPTLNYQTERLLSYLPDEYLNDVWNVFERRLKHKRDEEDGLRYEAVPHRFQFLAEKLSSDIPLAIRRVRSLYREDCRLFAYKGGKLMYSVFRQCTPQYANALISLIQDGDGGDCEFVSALMLSYHGEHETHGILQALLLKCHDSDSIRSKVTRSIENTGVLRGEYGHVEAIRGKKALTQDWLDSPEPIISSFARQLHANLDRDILEAQRRADTRIALRRLEYDTEDEQGDE